MKVITVKQPWAWLLCAGIKDIENRTWRLPDKYKGERIHIHASATYDSRHRDMSKLFTKNQWNELERLNLTYAMSMKSFDLSAIIGSVQFINCVENHKSVWAEHYENDVCPRCGTLETITLKKENTCLMCNYKWKNQTIYNWVSDKPILFDEPILNVKGKLSFWNHG